MSQRSDAPRQWVLVSPEPPVGPAEATAIWRQFWSDLQPICAWCRSPIGGRFTQGSVNSGATTCIIVDRVAMTIDIEPPFRLPAGVDLVAIPLCPSCTPGRPDHTYDREKHIAIIAKAWTLIDEALRRAGPTGGRPAS